MPYGCDLTIIQRQHNLTTFTGPPGGLFRKYLHNYYGKRVERHATLYKCVNIKISCT